MFAGTWNSVQFCQVCMKKESMHSFCSIRMCASVSDITTCLFQFFFFFSQLLPILVFTRQLMFGIMVQYSKQQWQFNVTSNFFHRTRWIFFTTVSLKWLHNHEVSSADALRRRDVSDKAVQNCWISSRLDIPPTAALDTLKYDLQEQYSAEEYTRISADRSICPDLQFWFR